MLRTLTLLSAVGIAHAVPHHGAYMDPAHYKGDDSYAGMRYIAEGPPHVLTMIGSDDGATWYTLKGTCSEAGMGTLTFDFSPKGGPKELVGKSTERDDGVWTVVWPDGNAWVSVPSPDKTSSLATPPPPPPKPLCNCGCGGAGQCGLSCSSCDCEGCMPVKPACNKGCGGSGQCGAACSPCDCV